MVAVTVLPRSASELTETLEGYEDLPADEQLRQQWSFRVAYVVRAVTPRHETVYWVGAAGAAQDAGEGTDFYAVANQQVSVTPLQIDLTHTQQLPLLRGWLGA